MSDIDKLEMLVTVSRLLSSKLEIDDLLTTIMRLASRVVNSERASLYLFDEKTKELYFDVALDLDEELKKMRFKLGEGIAGRVAEEGRSIISNNVENEPSHTKKVDEKSGYITHSLLTCPMIIKGKIIGVVQAINKIDGEFTEEDKNNFEAFASQAAVAIENARLFNKVKSERNKLQNIFKVIEEAIVITDENGFIKVINDSGEKYFNYNQSDHKRIFEILSNFKVDVDIEKLISEKRNSKFILEKMDGRKVILECNLITDSFDLKTEKELLWIFSDITERVIESRISRELVSIVSHKFKTPITSIVGFSQLIYEQINDEKQKKMLESIITQGFKLNSLVDDMIEFSLIKNKNKSDLKIETINSSKIIEVVRGFVKKEKDVEFITTEIDRFDIEVDVELFSKAIIEIIKNGIKHNKKSRKKIEIITSKENNLKLISIKDNGNGIEQFEMDRIFDEFYQVEPSGFTAQTEGWGIGLYIVKRILEFHNFSYRIKSIPDEYTTFTIIIP